jgi:hypothetical protein
MLVHSRRGEFGLYVCGIGRALNELQETVHLLKESFTRSLYFRILLRAKKRSNVTYSRQKPAFDFFVLSCRVTDSKDKFVERFRHQTY